MNALNDNELTVSLAQQAGSFPLKITVTHMPTGMTVMGTGKDEPRLVGELKTMLANMLATAPTAAEAAPPIQGSAKLPRKYVRKPIAKAARPVQPDTANVHD